jgi:diadenosine tetraphosphatase ApaH/serine/threonine PP2A family protein phosphatase
VSYVILSDIHGNLEALEAVLADLAAARPAGIACLGDYVGYGAAPNECMERLRPIVETAVLGNHDAAALGRLRLGGFNSDAATAARWTGEALSAASRAYLESLPYAVVWHGARLVHASPLQPEIWNYVLSTADAEEEMAAYDETLCFIGHSHFPGTFERDPQGVVHYSRGADIEIAPDRRYLVNVPSVGQPRDGDPRAGYLLWDDRKGTLRHVRVEYDVATAMKRIVDAGLPRFLAERLQWGE